MKLAYDAKWHKYRIDGKACKNISKLAEIPDDKAGLEKWKLRSVVAGLVEKPILMDEARDADNAGDLNRVADKAINASKNGDAAAYGTWVHDLLERHDLERPTENTAEARALISAWDKGLAEAKLKIDPAFIERCLVYPGDKIAGRMDRFVTVGRRKGMAVLDLKTGKVDYPHKFAVQLGLYANAHFIACDLDIRGETSDFDEMPDMDLRTGYIVHIPSPFEVEIFTIDIGAGYEAFKKAIQPTLKWRATKANDLLKSVCRLELEDPDAGASVEAHDLIRARLAVIKAHDELPGHPSGVNLTRSRWPGAIPPRGPWTNAHIDKLDQLLTTVERDAGVPF